MADDADRFVTVRVELVVRAEHLEGEPLTEDALHDVVQTALLKAFGGDEGRDNPVGGDKDTVNYAGPGWAEAAQYRLVGWLARKVQGGRYWAGDVGDEEAPPA